MSTYIQGVTDYLPQLQPFHPDLNYYSNVLQTKQSQYDIAHKQISQQYGTLLNAPMLREGNIVRRDKFFKDLDQDIKKISKLDLSQEQNVSAAMQAFRPLYEDKNIVKDMTFTKQLHNELSRAENFKTCVDPEKCGGQYWDEGVKAMQYHAEEFKNASDEASLSFESPTYKPFINVTKNAIKEAKAAGFNITMDRKSGGYIVTDSNGQLLTGTANHPGILPNYLYGIFKDDQKAMDVFNTQAYVARKDFAKTNALQYGSEDAAEAAYINNILHSSVKSLEKDAADSKEMYDTVGTNAKVLTQQIKQDGGLIKDSPEDSLYQAYQHILAGAPAAAEYHDKVQNTIEGAKNISDIRLMRQRVDNIVAHDGFKNTIWNAANEYVMGTQKQEIKADPFSLEAVRFQYEKQLKSLDFEVWKQKKSYEKAETYNTLLSLGLSPEEAMRESLGVGGSGVSSARIKELKKRGAGKGLEGKDTQLPVEGAGAKVLDTVVKNDNLYDTQAAQVLKSSSSYLKNVAENLRDAAQNTTLSAEERNLATQGLKDIFKGTKFDVNKYLSSDLSSDEIDNLNPTEIVGRQNLISNMSKQQVSKFWNTKELNLVRAKSEMERQTLSNMTKDREKYAKLAVDNIKTDLLNESDGKDISSKLLAVGAILGPGGNIKDRESAAKAYAVSASKYYQADPKTIIVGRVGEEIPNVGAKSSQQKAYEDFKKNIYDNTVAGYNNAYHTVKGRSFEGTGEFSYEGGATAVQKAKTFIVKPNEDLSQNTNYANTVINNFQKLQGQPGVEMALGANQTPEGVQAFINAYEAGDRTLKSSNFTIQSTHVPEIKKGDGAVVPERIVQTITPSADYVRSTLRSTGVKYNPTADYSFSIQYPANADETGFAQATTLTGTQAMMNLPGNSLTYSDPNKAAFVLKKDKNGYTVTGTQKFFNMDTGEMEDAPLVLGRQDISPDLDTEEAYLRIVKKIEDEHETFVTDAKRAYILKHKNQQNGG